RELLPPPLRALARRELDLQHRFTLKLITLLSDRLTRAGLQLFKINKTALHICAARPRFLDLEANPASDSVRRILEAVTAQPGLNRRQLLEKLGVPLPPPAPEGQAAAEAPPPSPELAGLIAPLPWLIPQGHVIEYADGRPEAGKRPPPRPTPPPPKPAAPVPAKEPPPVPAQAAPAADPAGDAVPPPPATEQAVAVPPEEPVPSPS
ncbi:MAG TPA: hypothetical protein PKE47_15100, partial [Verrucomicrobiota bacterium]|nr:hypothetical protein [Verrucomicrobiota bacterium]